jgi:squalene synthase HpnC
VPVGHYENFPVASLLLPATLRRPVEIIYRFARSADDLADEGDDPPEARLAKLEAYRSRLFDPGSEKRFVELAALIHELSLPRQLFVDLLDAFSQDVVKQRYASYAELAAYCRRSADPVGRLLLHLFKRTSDSNLRRSDAICSGLQLVNFWQDVALDYRKGRIYLPQDEMAAHQVTERHIAEARCDAHWQALMGFQVERARGMLLEGWPLGRALPGRVGLEIRATVQGGLAILRKIERAGYDVFRSRPVLRALDWPSILVRAL